MRRKWPANRGLRLDHSLLMHADPLLASPASRDVECRRIPGGFGKDGLGAGEARVFFGGNAGQQFKEFLNAFHDGDLRKGVQVTV